MIRAYLRPFLWALFASAVLIPSPSIAQEDAVDKTQEAEHAEHKQDNEGEAKKDDEVPLIEATRSESDELGAREIRFHLWDDSVVTGDVGVNAIHIQTKFGMLEVPVENIVTFRPGINSLPGVKQEIDDLFEQLGDREFQTRDRAKRALMGKGVTFLDYLKSLDPGNNAELKKNAEAIIQALSEERESGLDETTTNNPPIGNEDSITTGTFTIVGDIQEESFALTTKYGNLNIELNAIREGDRAFNFGREAIQRSVDIDAKAFFQLTPVATRIRINAGDRIKIKARGDVQWASWGNVNSSPDGITNQGSWNWINSGTLTARIGKSTDYIHIGSRNEFVAKTSGELFLGIAIQDNYARQNGYQWNGKYTADIRVEPGNTP
ncbi:MAG: hypothetical protein R3C03_12895 [Pirellulaceae bacterium]